MKKLLLLLTILSASAFGQTVQCQSASGAWGPCPFVQPVVVATVGGTAQINNKVSAASGTTITNTFPGSTTAGNSIVCLGFEAAAATPVFTDAQTNTYIVAESSGAAAPGYTVAIANNIVGGTTDTITLTTTSGSASFTCYELKGAVSVGQIWDYTAAAQGTSTTLVFTQESAAIANDFVAVGVGMGAGTVNATPSLAGVPSTLTTVDQANTAPLSGGSTPALSVFYSAHANVTNSPTFTQSVSISASETYSAVLVAIKPASISLVGNVQDPCQQGAGTSGVINLTAGGTLITGTAGKQTYVCSMNLVTATAQNIAIVEGTGTVCATNIAGMAGGSTAATGWNLAANEGIVYGGGGFWVFKTATAGDNVCLLLSSSGQTSATIDRCSSNEMKRLFLILIFTCIFTCSAFATPTFVQVNCGNGTGCTQATATALNRFALTNNNTAGNDLLAFISWKTATRTISYVCGDTANTCTNSATTGVFLPYSSLVLTGSSTANQIWICHKCAAISHIAVDFSGTTVLDVQLLEYSGVVSIGQITSSCTSIAGACTLANSANPTISITIQDANNIVVMGTSSLGSDGIPTAVTGNLRAAARSGTTASFDAGSACDNTSSSAGTSVTCKVAITSSAWTAIGVELRSATAAMTDHVQSNGPNTAGPNESGTLTSISGAITGDPILAGNTVACAITYPVGSTLSSIVTSTTLGGSTVDTFPAADVTVTGATSILKLFHLAPTTGVTFLTVTFGSALPASPNFAYTCSQFNNVASSSALDVSCSNTSQAGPNLKCSSGLTIGSQTDLVFAAEFPDAATSGFALGSYCAAGYGYGILIANPVTPYCTQFGLFASTASTTPSFYASTSANATTNSFNVAAIALKTNGGGTAAPAFGISRSYMIYALGTNTIYGNCPSTGNFLTGSISQSTVSTYVVIDSNQVAYSVNAPLAGSSNQMVYSTNSTLDASSMCKYIHNASGNDESQMRDITGAATSSPFDTMSTACPSPSTYGATGCYNSTGSTSGTISNLPNIRPTSSGELVVTNLQIGTGPPTMSGPSGSISDCPAFTGETDNDAFCSGEGHGHFFTIANGSSENWSWTWTSATAVGAVGFAINPTPAAPIVAGSLMLLGVGR